MRKRWFLSGIAFLLTLLLLVGCGVPKKDYDSVVTQLSQTQGELKGVKVELETSQARVSELATKLDKTEAELKKEQVNSAELAVNLEKIQTELETAKTEKAELTSNLQTTQSQLTSTRSEYSTFKSDIKSKWDRFDKVSALEYFIVGYWNAAAKGDSEQIEQMTAKMITYVEPIHDSNLDNLWKQAMSAAEKGQEALFLESFAALMERNSILFNEMAKVIRDKLAE